MHSSAAWKSFLTFGSLVIAATTPPTARTLNGSYSGTTVPSLSQDIFLGIPFANQRRFEQATPLGDTWNDTREANTPGLTCAGFGTNPRQNWAVGEDCLNLNIVRPQGAFEGLDLPVLVWIYGGGYRQGSNRDPEFNTSFIVQTSIEIEHPIVVVSINYRLSAFGFLTSQETGGNGAQNIGLFDQRMALRWIKENIRGFGGDPNRMTIWGESAGAASTAFQIMAYGGDTQDLFQGAIMASGTMFGFGGQTTSGGQAVYNNITTHTGCADAVDTLECLKRLPFAQLNETVYGQNEGQQFAPSIDGDFFREYPFKAFKNGRLPSINIIVGCNSDEGISLGGQTTANTSTELQTYLSAALGISPAVAQELLDLYPLEAPSPPYSVPMDYPWVSATAEVGIASGNQTRRAYGIFGDKQVMAGRRKVASSWSSFGGKAYSYRWDVDPTHFPLVVTPGLGPGFAQHGAELSYQFRLPYIAPTPYPPLPNVKAMHQVSYAMQAAWVSFAATGSPNHHGLEWVPDWPAYGGKSDNGTYGAMGKRNFVFNVTLDDVLNLHVEEDAFREAGMKWINERWAVLNRDPAWEGVMACDPV